jgi:signal transduction histidine kinase
MDRNKIRQRIQALFADLELLVADPRSNTPKIQRELESLRARLVELEQQVLSNEPGKSGPSNSSEDEVQGPEARPIRPGVYEEDRVGYVFADEKLESLKDSAKELASPQNGLSSPLAIGEQVIGGVQIETPDQHQVTPEEQSLANAVAQQAALQIQNLRLLAATERSRAEAETASRRVVHEGWESYLDAIHQSERIGYSYDQGSVVPYLDNPQVGEGLEETVSVMDEKVGRLYLKPNPGRPFTDTDRSLIGGVADQVAAQIENIRLQADAARARAQAEEAVRRLTGETWKKYADDRDESQLGFVYDSQNVTPLDDQAHLGEVALSQPLKVRGEIIGRLAVAGGGHFSAEAAELAAAIAAQASIHLETLRLSEELQKRARDLEELDRLKSAFLANMSHELRTPLNSILGFTDVMLEELDGPLTDNMDNDLKLVQKNGRHLLHLINDVLDMAKIEAGRMNLNPEKFNMHSVLEEVVSITSTLASERNLSLFIAEDSDRELEIYADSTRLRQIMINLVNNSIKFTEKGAVTICAKPIENARVLITVKDTGIGIAPNQLESIFQEFAQVDTSATRKVGGTGLGLPISRRLVEMHGGRLWAESTGIGGEGSTFHVELPLEAVITDVLEKFER